MKRAIPSKRKPAAVTWNAADYAANSAPQQSWAREGIATLKLRGNEHILDVGCGDGKVTAEIASLVPKGLAVGIDASSQMIEFAKKTFPPNKFSNLRFQILDAREIQPGAFSPGFFDILFSNAALHWVDDHPAFLRGAASVLKPGGRLVVSCGGKGNAHDVYVALRPEMRAKRWREYFRQMPQPYFFHAPEEYKRWLPRFGFKVGKVHLAPKDAVYAGAEGFATWLRTTWLPYVQRVPEDLREEFIAAVTARYVAKHPPDKSHHVHVRMVRLEIEALKTNDGGIR